MQSSPQVIIQSDKLTLLLEIISIPSLFGIRRLLFIAPKSITLYTDAFSVKDANAKNRENKMLFIIGINIPVLCTLKPLINLYFYKYLGALHLLKKIHI